MAKPALGRGLGALLGNNPTSTSPAASIDTPSERVQEIAHEKIRPSPLQPRRDFSEESLQELASSIREQGIIQPLIVRLQNGHYELIAGERRWRAAKIAGLQKIPVIVRKADDGAVLELALIENLQRENLNPIEEALGYSQLMTQFRLTQEAAAQKVGRSRAVVANALRLLNLATELQTHIRQGQLSVGHAKVILGLADPAKQKLAAQRVIQESLSVRQTEELIAALQNPTPLSRPASASIPRDPHVGDIESKLQEKFGTKVQLHYKNGKGSLQIRFFNQDDLERIIQILGVKAD